MLQLSEPKVIERGPYQVVGCYARYEGDDEGPGWRGASEAFFDREGEIVNRADDKTLGFLHRPNKDDPTVDPEVRACFVGAEVTDLAHVPEGMATTRFPGGQYVIVACQGDTEGEAAMGVGEAIGMLMSKWIPENGYREGGACFACSLPAEQKPPYVEYVYIHIEPLDG